VWLNQVIAGIEAGPTGIFGECPTERKYNSWIGQTARNQIRKHLSEAMGQKFFEEINVWLDFDAGNTTNDLRAHLINA
jgi:hypothetical protein